MYSMILAMDMHGLIGRNNDLPWHYPEDLKYFKKLTSHHTVLMGRRTFDSIINRLGKPLPNRHHIVASRSDVSYQEVEVINDLESYLKRQTDQNVFIIGGKQIFDVAMAYVDIIYVTHIKHIYEGDTYMNIDFSLFDMDIINETDDLIYCKYVRKSQ